MMKKENIKALLVLHIVLFFYSMGGICSKLAAKEDFLSVRFLFYYGMVLGILFLYAVLWQQILKKLPLVIAYVNKAVTVIWGLFWGYLVFEESVTPKKLLACLVIIVGIYCVTTEKEEKA